MFVTHFALILFMCATEICHGEGEEPAHAKNKLQGMFSGLARLLSTLITAKFLFF